MKKSIIVFISVLFFLNANGQIIKGNVYDLTDKKPINHASIYFNGTMVGTISDEKGFFKLDVSKYPSMPLSVSALGYDAVTLKGYSSEKPVEIYMTPKIFELKDVVISDKSLAKARKANMSIFRSCFLGKTPNGMLSDILNEEDIHFSYDEGDTLKAYSTRPLIIENRGLGYVVTFFLDEFEYYRRNEGWFFLGTILFNEEINMEESLRKRYEKRRRNAFMGSKMQFFRVLWKNELDSAGFQVKDTSGKILNYSDIVIEDDGIIKYLWYPEILFIHYRTDQSPSSIEFRQDEVFFEESGFFDALGIVWGGQMAKQLIGDWLPYEYTITDN